MTERAPANSRLKQVRLLLWLLVAVAAVGAAALLLMPSARMDAPQTSKIAAQSSFGGPFTLVGADSKPFSSARLMGKPYAMYFGFTRCGDVCPTTLSRMVKLRQELGGDRLFNIVFVTIDPTHDGPTEVGQYAQLFNSPIIGLTGSPAQIDKVKKQFGIYAQPVPNAPMGQQMEHSAIVLLFDRAGSFIATISPDEPDSDALAKLKRVIS
jgi:protein SCO1/2